MKNRIKHISIVIICLLIITSGVIFIFRARIKTHFFPIVEQIGDINIKIKNDTAYVSSKLTAKNKSMFNIEVDTIKYKISLFNKTYLQSQKFVGMTLPGYGKDTIDFSVKIPYLTILTDLKAQRKKGDSVSYSINIFLQYSTIFGKSEVPINKAAKIKIPQPPELEVIEIKYKKIRLKSIHADAKIKIINYNAVALSIKSMSYTMKVLKQGELTGNYSEPIRIKPNETTYINLPIEIHANSLIKTAFEVLINKDNYNYTLTLNAILESTDSTKKYFHIHLIKNGKMELKK